MSLIKAFKASNKDGVALISPSHHHFGRNFIFCIIWLGYVILYFSFEAEAEAEGEFMWLRQLHTRRVHDQKAPATRRKKKQQTNGTPNSIIFCDEKKRANERLEKII